MGFLEGKIVENEQCQSVVLMSRIPTASQRNKDFLPMGSGLTGLNILRLMCLLPRCVDNADILLNHAY